MTEYKTHILSTRPLEAALLDQAAGKGIWIDPLPFIVTEPLIDETLRLRIQDLSRSSLLAIFTSMNAVEAVAEYLKNIPAITTTARPDWHIFCIGSATSHLVREYFGEEHITGTAASATDLADTIINWLKRKTKEHPQTSLYPGTELQSRNEQHSGTRQQAEPPEGTASLREVFFFCGDQRRDELPQKLRQQDIKVNELMVYKTTQTPHKIDRSYDGIVFFSPSAVHSFFRVNNIPADTTLFAIGQTTADTIRTYTTNQTIISQSADKSALIRQVIDYYNHPLL